MSSSQSSSIRIKTSKAGWAKKKQIQSNTKKQNDKQWPDLTNKTKTKSIESSNDNNTSSSTPNIKYKPTAIQSNGHTNIEDSNNPLTPNQNISSNSITPVTNKPIIDTTQTPNNTANVNSPKKRKRRKKKPKILINNTSMDKDDNITPQSTPKNDTNTPKNDTNTPKNNDNNQQTHTLTRTDKHTHNAHRDRDSNGYSHHNNSHHHNNYNRRHRGRRHNRMRGRGRGYNSYRNNNNYYEDDGYYRNNRRNYRGNNYIPTAPRHNRERHKNNQYNDNNNNNNNNNNNTYNQSYMGQNNNILTQEGEHKSDTATTTTTASNNSSNTTPTTPIPVVNNMNMNMNMNINNMTYINPYMNIYNMNPYIINPYMNLNVNMIEPNSDTINLCINQLQNFPDWTGEISICPGPYYVLKVSCVATGYSADDRSVGHIALIDWNLKTKANIFVKPSQDIISYIEPLTSLNSDLLSKYGYTLDAAIEIIKSELPSNAVLIGQNITMDLQWLGLKHGIDFKTFIDLRDIWRTWSEYYKSYTHYSLNHQSKCILNIDISDYKIHKHSASFDGITTMKLFQYYAYCRYFNMSLFHNKIQLLKNTKIQPSFSKINPIYEGVQMQSKKYKGVPYITNIAPKKTTANNQINTTNKNKDENNNNNKNDKKIINIPNTVPVATAQ